MQPHSSGVDDARDGGSAAVPLLSEEACESSRRVGSERNQFFGNGHNRTFTVDVDGEFHEVLQVHNASIYKLLHSVVTAKAWPASGIALGQVVCHTVVYHISLDILITRHTVHKRPEMQTFTSRSQTTMAFKRLQIPQNRKNRDSDDTVDSMPPLLTLRR